MGSIPGREDPLEEEMASVLVFLPEESHGQRTLAGYGPQGCQELDTTEANEPTGMHAIMDQISISRAPPLCQAQDQGRGLLIGKAAGPVLWEFIYLVSNLGDRKSVV